LGTKIILPITKEKVQIPEKTQEKPRKNDKTPAAGNGRKSNKKMGNRDNATASKREKGPGDRRIFQGGKERQREKHGPSKNVEVYPTGN